MLPKIKVSNHFLISILIILFLILLYLIFDLLLYSYLNSDKIIHDGKLAANELDISAEIFFKEVQETAEELAEAITNGVIDKNHLVYNLKQTLKFDHNISSIGALFKPYSYDPNLRLYSPYIVRDGTTLKEYSFDSYYDYTTNSIPWFNESIERENNWTLPFYDEISQKEYIYFTKKFLMPSSDGESIEGIIFIGVSTSDVRQKLSALNLNFPGQSYLVTSEGFYVIQPSDSRINTSERLEHIKSASETEYSKIHDPDTNEYIYQFYRTMKSNDWIIVFEIVESRITENFSSFRKKAINIIIALNILLTALSFFFMKRITRNYQSVYMFWYFSIPLFVIYIISSIYICHLGLNYQDKTEIEQNAILNESQLEDFKLEYIDESLDKKEEPPVFIPTGIFIESIAFSSSGTVNIKGLVWQKYYNFVHDDVSRTITIPNANDENLTKIFEKSFGDFTLIEWDFNVSLDSNFDYKKYPFNNENLWLLLKHQDFDKNIVLVPDLDSYNLNSSRYRPGLDKNIRIRNWEIQNSYFSYTFDTYNTNFGIKNFVGQSNFPENYFNIILKPNILNVFISNFLPIIIALFLLYGIFKTATGHYVIRPYATLFLALIFLQISLRNNLGANEIVYIEYYYFLIYFIMVGVSLNVVLVENSDLDIVKYKNNLIPKLLFWPFTGLAIFLLNIFVFYN